MDVAEYVSEVMCSWRKSRGEGGMYTTVQEDRREGANGRANGGPNESGGWKGRGPTMGRTCLQREGRRSGREREAGSVQPCVPASVSAFGVHGGRREDREFQGAERDREPYCGLLARWHERMTALVAGRRAAMALVLRASPALLLPRPRLCPSAAYPRAPDPSSRVRGAVQKRQYLLDVVALRNQHPPSSARAPRASASAQEEIQAFEQWALLKLKRDGCSAEPVIHGMRASLLLRLGQASPPLPAASSHPLPVEKDPLLAAGAVRPIVVTRRATVPENWDGPGGTVVLIDKPRGWSSFAVCGKLRHMLGVKKVGHAGTLDPLSTGLLIVCVGKATKLADSYQAMTKVYSGTMRIGETTSSLDAGTPISEELPWEHIEEQDMRNAVEKSFLGDIMQVPPMYSAIKVKGERLYTKARRGEEIAVAPRPVKVYDFQLKRSTQNRQEWDFCVKCSKGTYIRSLCADLALSLNSCAYLISLRREKIGGLSVDDAWPIGELETYYREVLRVPFRSYKSR